MSRNRVQHQKGLSDDAFERLYPDEEACRRAWFAWRWPEGFKCPRCAASEYCEIRDRQLLQCRRCRYQTSLIAGTVLQGTKLPMRVWFRAMHLLGQGKKGISNIELGRRLGISTNAAWRLQNKLMQAMLERDRRYKLGAAGPRIEIDDAYIGGERTGEGSEGGAVAVLAERAGAVGLEDVEGETAQAGEHAGIGADARAVFAEGDIAAVVGGGLDPPMRAHRLSGAGGGERGIGDIEGGLVGV